MKHLFLSLSIFLGIGLISCSNDSKQSNKTTENEEESFTCLCCEPVLEEAADSVQN